MFNSYLQQEGALKHPLAVSVSVSVYFMQSYFFFFFPLRD